MKKTWSLLAVVFICGFATHGAFGLDIGAMFNIGNYAFSPNRASTDTSFSGTYLPWGLSLTANQQLSQNLDLSTRIAYADPILRNIASATVTYQGNYFSLGAGPMFGFFNSTSSPLNPGIVTNAQVQIPGILFLAYQGASSLGGSLVQTGDFFQQRSDFSIGTYLPDVILSANVSTRKYTEKSSAGYTIDEQTEYSLKTNIFQKAVPYRILLTFGYQTLSKTFLVGSTTTVDQLGAILLGTRVEFQVQRSVTIITDLESNLYTFGQNALLGLSNPGPYGYLFQLRTGVRISLDRLLGNR